MSEAPLIEHLDLVNKVVSKYLEGNNETAISNAKNLADGSPDPKYSLGLLKQQKIIDGWPKPLTENSPALIVDLPTNDKNGDSFVDYVVGLKNFEVITL